MFEDFTDEKDELKDAKGKLKSEDEIKKMCLEEDQSSNEKLITILNSGTREQKDSIITFLNEYLPAPLMTDAINKLIDLIPSFDQELQETTALSLARCCDKNLIPETCVEKIELFILKLFDNADEELFRTWTPTFISSILCTSFSFLRDNVIPYALKMIEFKQVDMTRIVGAKLLVEIAKIPKELTGELLRSVQNLCQYNNWKIRLLLAVKIKEICRNLSREKFESTFLEELLELCGDEEIQVRLEAIESGLSLIEIMSESKFKTEFMPILLKHLSSSHEETQHSISKSLGRILELLCTRDLVKDKEWKIFDDFIQDLFTTNDLKIKLDIIEVLPSVIRLFLQNNRQLDFYEYIHNCSESKEDAVKQALAKHFASYIKELTKNKEGYILREIFLNLSDTKEFDIIEHLVEDLGNIIKGLLQENEIRKSLFDDEEEEEERKQPKSARGSPTKSKDPYSLFMGSNSKKCSAAREKEKEKEEREERERLEDELFEFYEDLRGVIIFMGDLVKNKSWRVYARFLENIPKVGKHLKSEEFNSKYLEISLNVLREGTIPLKKSASHCVVGLLWITYSKKIRLNLLKTTIENLSTSPSFYIRMAFLYFSEAFLLNFSSIYIDKYLLNALFKLSKDKSAGIRYRYCAICPILFKIINCGENPNGDAVISTLGRLQNDSDIEVQTRAEEAMCNILNQDFWNEKVRIIEENKNQSKILHENNFAILEAQADEESKLRERDDLPSNSVHLEYLQLVNPTTKLKKKRKSSGFQAGKGPLNLSKMLTDKGAKTHSKYLLGGSSVIHRTSTGNLKKRKAGNEKGVLEDKGKGKKLKNEDGVKSPPSKFGKKADFKQEELKEIILKY